MDALLPSLTARPLATPTLAQCVLMGTSCTRDATLLLPDAVSPLQPVNAPLARPDTISLPQRLAVHASTIALPAMPWARLGAKLVLRALPRAISVVWRVLAIARLAQVEQEYVTSAIRAIITSPLPLLALPALAIAKYAHLVAALLVMMGIISVVLRAQGVLQAAKLALRVVALCVIVRIT